MPAPTLFDYSDHSPYSNPGTHAGFFSELSTEPEELHRFACSAVVHYRADGPTLTEAQKADPDRRWLTSILDAAEARAALDGPRTFSQQVAGCCRDHTLISLGVLRTHGIPARSRIGFATYFAAGWNSDHVVGERWDGGRWVRFDPELRQEDFDFDVHDMPTGPESPFLTAAEAWLAIRAGTADPAAFGVDPGLPDLSGKDFVRCYVLYEVAHRHRDELLLWDLWGPELSTRRVREAGDGRAATWVQEAGVPGDDVSDAEFDAVADELAYLLVAADAGDDEAADQLAELYREDVRLHPGGRVLTLSPTGHAGITDLAAH
ncbi:Transglutaminase-like superfamily protein [Promicromonospora umidemergens]|uniref:Transglutaminase-like domain-containing protein n=1 Tax=Promicromonospora umidemergens TaxID=629679 RepID=A0ABP8WUV4_9MICO|nr:transglutaminase-like domain-containing protein [Promicromonospora umidemergens]MCP2283688.1 Transglutaminase-like superfamily protein [Promicromonospora umidemergens]